MENSSSFRLCLGLRAYARMLRCCIPYERPCPPCVVKRTSLAFYWICVDYVGDMRSMSYALHGNCPRLAAPALFSAAVLSFQNSHYKAVKNVRIEFLHWDLRRSIPKLRIWCFRPFQVAQFYGWFLTSCRLKFWLDYFTSSARSLFEEFLVEFTLNGTFLNVSFRENVQVGSLRLSFVCFWRYAQGIRHLNQTSPYHQSVMLVMCLLLDVLRSLIERIKAKFG